MNITDNVTRSHFLLQFISALYALKICNKNKVKNILPNKRKPVVMI